MSDLEHLIENTLKRMEGYALRKEIPGSEIINDIENDINYKGSGINSKDCLIICLYVWDHIIKPQNLAIKEIEELKQHAANCKEQAENESNLITKEKNDAKVKLCNMRIEALNDVLDILKGEE